MTTRSTLFKRAGELTEVLESIDRTNVYIAIENGKIILHDGEEYDRKEIVVWEDGQ